MFLLPRPWHFHAPPSADGHQRHPQEGMPRNHVEESDLLSSFCTLNNLLVPVLAVAGIILQFCNHEANLFGYFVLGDESDNEHEEKIAIEVGLLDLFFRCLRSVVAMLILVGLRVAFSPLFVEGHRRRIDAGVAVKNDLFFHMQCRLLASTLMACLQSPSYPPTAIDLLVLMMSALRQGLV